MIPHALVDAWLLKPINVFTFDEYAPNGTHVARRSLGGDKYVLSLGIAQNVTTHEYEIWATRWGKWRDVALFPRVGALHACKINATNVRRFTHFINV